MKKLAEVLLFAILMVSVVASNGGGLGSSVDTQKEIDERVEDRGITFTARGGEKSILEFNPQLFLNDKIITISSLEFYQDEVDHEFRLYVILGLNLSQLDENDIHWMDKDKALDFNLSITDERNNFDNQDLSSIAPFWERDGISTNPLCFAGMERDMICLKQHIL